MTQRILRYCISTAALLLLVFTFHNVRKPKEVYMGESFSNTKIKCAIDLARYDDSTKVLLTGYNYALLKDFASDMSSEVEILIPEKDENYLDSLDNGNADIVVIPYRHGNFSSGEALASSPIDSLSIWLLNKNNMAGLMELNDWISKYHKSNRFKKYHRLFVHTFHDPYKEAELGIIRSEISPYDSLFKVYSKKIGWDWKLLAALAFKESKFRIDAHSHRGATGLMQMVPVTADRFELEDLLDPEENIKAGTNYLDWLQNIFGKRVNEGSPDMVYFILASYNCGEGHVIDCINYAQSKGIYDGTWASVCHILPDMSSSEAVASDSSVKLGKFNTELVINYVDEILSIKETFDEMCPDIR